MRVSPVQGSETELVLRVSGDLDIASANLLISTAEQALAESSRGVLVLDLAEVDFIDSTGIGALVTIRNTTKARDIVLVLRSPGTQVRRFLEIANLDTVFALDG
jgi:anti-sigma B factor antagonist